MNADSTRGKQRCYFLKKFLLGLGALVLILAGGSGTQSSNMILQGGGFIGFNHRFDSSLYFYQNGLARDGGVCRHLLW